MSRGCFDALDDLVEEGCAVGLVVVAGVVSLSKEDGDEFGSGAEVGAGFAGGLHAAFELDWSCAEPVAEHSGVGFAAQSGHGDG